MEQKKEKEVVTTNNSDKGFDDPFESDAPVTKGTVQTIGETCTSCEG